MIRPEASAEINTPSQTLATPSNTDPTANQSLYHSESIRTGLLLYDSDIHSDYDRDLEDYIEELNRPGEPYGRQLFRISDWTSKTILDIGAGGHDRFAREAHERGVRVISLNPALRDSRERSRTQQPDSDPYDELLTRPAIDTSNHGVLAMLRKTLFGHRGKTGSAIRMAEDDKTPERVAALGQALPFADSSVDCVVSVFAVPHYLHHVNPSLDMDADIVAAYTPQVREQDKQLIGQAFSEIVRVLKPRGKAYLKDTHRGAKQNLLISPYSPSDGTEVLEVLEELKGADVKVYERENALLLGRFSKEEIPSCTERTIVLTKTEIVSSEQ